MGNGLGPGPDDTSVGHRDLGGRSKTVTMSGKGGENLRANIICDPARLIMYAFRSTFPVAGQAFYVYSAGGVKLAEEGTDVISASVLTITLKLTIALDSRCRSRRRFCGPLSLSSFI